MLKSSLCDYSDTHTVVKGTITVPNTAATAAAATKNNGNKKVIFKNCTSFTDYISQINNRKPDNSKDIDKLMSMHNLIEYSGNYWKMSINNNGAIVEFNETD